MIRCSDTRDYQPTFSLIQCWSGLSHITGTLAHKLCSQEHVVQGVSYEDQRRSTPLAFLALFT